MQQKKNTVICYKHFPLTPTFHFICINGFFLKYDFPTEILNYHSFISIIFISCSEHRFCAKYCNQHGLLFRRIEQIQRTPIHTATIRKINDDNPIATCIQGDNKIFSFETLKKRYEFFLTKSFFFI